MGIRRKKVSDRLRRRVEELLETRTPAEVFEILQGTRDQISRSEIYKIRGTKVKLEEDYVRTNIMADRHQTGLPLTPYIHKDHSVEI